MTNKSRALLLVAHGSRRDASNDEVRELTDTIRESAQKDFFAIDCAFLELAAPLIPDAIDSLVEKGAQEIVVFPYFLSAGRHVAKDIPEILDDRRNAHPNVDIREADYLGAASQLPNLIGKLVASS